MGSGTVFGSVVWFEYLLVIVFIVFSSSINKGLPVVSRQAWVIHRGLVFEVGHVFEEASKAVDVIAEERRNFSNHAKALTLLFG